MDEGYQHQVGCEKACFHIKLCATRLFCCLPGLAFIAMSIACLPMLVISVPVWCCCALRVQSRHPQGEWGGPTLGRNRATQRNFGVGRFTEEER